MPQFAIILRDDFGMSSLSPDELRGLLRAMRIVAAEAGHAVLIHRALHVVVTLHAVLVSGAVRPVRSGLLAEHMLFQPPEVGQTISRLITNRPVVVETLDRIADRLALGMTLDTGIHTTHQIDPAVAPDVRSIGRTLQVLTES